MRRLASSIKFFEFVYVLLGFLQMKRNFQAHEGRYLTNEVGAVRCFRVPERRSGLKMLDVRENLLRVSFAQIDTVTGS